MRTFRLEGFGELPFARKQAYAFYKMVPLEDGFPGRRLADGTIAPHPIYATYLIRDLVNVHRETFDPEVLRAARRIADATVKRMESYRGALILFYAPDGLLSVQSRFYSGLTQARYLTCFYELYRETRAEKYKLIAEKIFDSLTIDVKHGGVCRTFEDGAVIEEFPHETPNFVLNGWTTAIIQVFEYARASGSEEAREFGERNMIALRRLLPLYDLPDLANSRYRLSGLAVHRLVGPITVEGGKVEVGAASYAITPGDAAWDNTVRPDGEGKLRVDTVLSRASWPAENSITLDVVAEAATKVVRYLAKAEYDGLTVRPKRGWTKTETHLVPEGRSILTFTVPWDQVPLVGAPTNFSKRVQEPDGSHTQRNVYHFLHLSNLEKLWELTGDESLVPWIAKWFEYTKRWPEMSIYQKPDIDFRPVGAFRLSSLKPS